MADINRDLDRYLRKKRENNGVVQNDSWFDRMFTDDERLDKVEKQQLTRVEKDIRKKEEEVAMVHELEEKLEEEQEEKVSFYHKLLRMFQRPREPEVIELQHPAAPPEDETLKEDLRELARIQTHWLSRLPTRIREEFKESDDYRKMTEILSRRGVARKK